MVDDENLHNSSVLYNYQILQKTKIFVILLKLKWCIKNYLRSFWKETQLEEYGYASYRRRKPIVIKNRFIVPYSTLLLKTFDTHINEFSNSVKSICL